VEAVPVRRLLTLCALAPLALLAASCGPAAVVNPPGDPAKPKLAKGLHGAWFGGSKEPGGMEGLAFIHFAPRKDGLTDMVLVGHHEEQGAAPLCLRGYPVGVGKEKYLCLKLMLSTDYTKQADKFAEDYWLVKYAIDGDGVLKLSYFGSDAATRLIKARELKGNQKDGKVTAGRKELTAFLRTKEAAKSFEKFGAFKRLNLAAAAAGLPGAGAKDPDKALREFFAGCLKEVAALSKKAGAKVGDRESTCNHVKDLQALTLARLGDERQRAERARAEVAGLKAQVAQLRKRIKQAGEERKAMLKKVDQEVKSHITDYAKLLKDCEALKKRLVQLETDNAALKAKLRAGTKDAK
jgi:hypothetical protein